VLFVKRIAKKMMGTHSLKMSNQQNQEKRRESKEVVTVHLLKEVVKNMVREESIIQDKVNIRGDQIIMMIQEILVREMEHLHIEIIMEVVIDLRKIIVAYLEKEGMVHRMEENKDYL